MEACRYGLGETEAGDVLGRDVKVGGTSGAMVEGVDAGTTSADAAAAVTHSPVHSG